MATIELIDGHKIEVEPKPGHSITFKIGDNVKSVTIYGRQ